MTHPREKIEEKPRIFLIFFCFILPNLPIAALNIPKIINKDIKFLIAIKIKGIIFCQIDKSQINPQASFWIIFKYQN
jgi:hypothetical protein